MPWVTPRPACRHLAGACLGPVVVSSQKNRPWRRPLRAIENHPIAASLSFVLIVTAVFLTFSEIDLWVSELFFRSEGGFVLRGNKMLAFFRSTNNAAVTIVVVVLIAQLAVKLARPERPSPVPPGIVVFLLSTLVLGSGLLVNVVLKDYWGRPRPVAIDAFGGESPYVEIWRITDYCDSNCSFVSGEASTAIWLLAIAFVLPKGIRLPAGAVILAYAVLLSLNRIAFGGHFASDVLLSFALTLLVIAVVHRIVIERPPRWLSNEALEAGLTRLGRFLARTQGGTGTA
jgi:lipid A 4'-phosphatase